MDPIITQIRLSIDRLWNALHSVTTRIDSLDALTTNEADARYALKDDVSLSLIDLADQSLSQTGVVPGSYGDATHVSQITVDDDGRLTSAASVVITGAAPGPHDLVGADHTAAGLTIGHFLKATGAAAFAFAAHGLSYTDVGAEAAGAVATHAALATGVHGAGANTLLHTGNASWIDLTDGGATVLHSHALSVHDIVGASHNAAGLTIGHFLKATGATTFAFGAHGLVYTDVGAAAASHAHAATDITSGTLNDARLSSNVVLEDILNAHTAFGTHSWIGSGVGNNILAVQNTLAGTGNAALFIAGNDASATALILAATSTTYTAAGVYPQDGVGVESPRVGGISIAATNAAGDIRFYAGGTTERVRISDAGRLGVGTDTPLTLLHVYGDFTLRGPAPWADVTAWGAVHDDSTDDTTAIQNAINAVASDGGGVVFLPTGVYRITSALQIKDGVRLIGQGTYQTSLKPYHASTHYAAITWYDAGDMTNWEIAHLSIDFTNCKSGAEPSVSTADIGISFPVPAGSTSPWLGHIHDVRINWAYRAVDDKRTFMTKYARIFSWSCRNGFLKHNGTTMIFEQCFHSGWTITGGTAGDRGFDFYAVGNAALSGCACDGMESNYCCYFHDCQGLTFTNFSFENNHTIGADTLEAIVFFDGCTGLSVHGLFDLNCTLNCPSDGNVSLVLLTNCDGSIISPSVGGSGSAGRPTLASADDCCHAAGGNAASNAATLWFHGSLTFMSVLGGLVFAPDAEVSFTGTSYYIVSTCDAGCSVVQVSTRVYGSQSDTSDTMCDITGATGVNNT